MKSALLTLFILFHLCQLGPGQIDSLFQLYREEQDETLSKNIFLKIQSICKKDVTCFQPIVDFLDQAGPVTPMICRTHYYLANAFFSSHLIRDTKNTGVRGIRQIGSYGPNKWLMLLHNTTALAYGHLSMVDSALYHADQAEQIVRQLNETTYAWRPDYTRYNAYESIHQFDLALHYLQQSYGYLKNSGDRMNKGFVLIELLRLTGKSKDETDFESWLQEYIRFQQEGNKSPDAIHANLHSLFQDHPDGIRRLEAALEKMEADSTSVVSGIDPVTSRMRLIDLYTEKGEHYKALQELKKLISDTTTSDQVIHNAYKGMIENYEQLHRFDSAYHYAMLYQDFQEKRFKKNLAENIAASEVRFQTQEKDRMLAVQQLTIQSNKARQRTLWGLFALMAVTAIFSGIYYRKKLAYQKMIQMKDTELHQNRIRELEHQNKLLSLNAMIEGQEAERLRIAQDLHDGLGGLLTSVKAHFTAIQLEMESLQNIKVFDRTTQLIDEACHEVRRIAHDMVPHSIQVSGLKGALEELVTAIELRGITCDLEVHSFQAERLSDPKASMIYRIVQELTQNAVKHSNATHIHIQLLGHDEQLHIMVEDNGKGFDVSAGNLHKGLGLKSIDSRIKYLGGNIQFDSSAQHGTVVNIELPL